MKKSIYYRFLAYVDYLPSLWLIHDEQYLLILLQNEIILYLYLHESNDDAMM